MQAAGQTRISSREKKETANVANGRECVQLKITPGQRPTSAQGAEVFTDGVSWLIRAPEGRFAYIRGSKDF